jgi:tetratricopeptide (TPR) repeat protein
MHPTVLPAIAAVLLLIPACSRLPGFHDTSHQLEVAKKRETTGDILGAINAYEGALGDSPRASEIHYRLAQIHADQRKDYVAAIHHFQRCLDLAPDGPFAKECRDYIAKEGHNRLVAKLGQGLPLTQVEAANLRNKVNDLVKENAELKAIKLAPQNAATSKSGDMSQKPIPAGARTHTIQNGETLASIAIKYYGNKSRYMQILNANFHNPEAAKKLKPGMVIMIP